MTRSNTVIQNMTDSPPPDEPIAPKTIESLPDEFLRMIFAYDDISLAQLYHLRAASRKIGRSASKVFVDRVHRVLLIRAQFDVFEAFLRAIQRLEDPTSPLQPESVGKLLKKARVPIHSVAVTAVARYLIEARRGGSHQKAAMLYKAMDAKVSDVRIALYGLGYWTDDFQKGQTPDDGRVDDPAYRAVGRILAFVKVFNFLDSEAADLMLSLNKMDIRDRWMLVSRLLGWREYGVVFVQEDTWVDTVINDYWPRVVKLARAENNDDRFDGMVTELDEVIYLFRARQWDASHQARLFEPGRIGLTIEEMARLMSHLTLSDTKGADFLGCYITDRSISPDNETDLSTRGTTTLPVQAQPDQARRLFAAMGRLDNFPQLLGKLMAFDRWPIYMDPSAPDFRELVVLDEPRRIEEVCWPLWVNIITGDAEIGKRKQSFLRFLSANALAPHFQTWLEVVNRMIETKRRFGDRVTMIGYGVFQDEEASDQKSSLVILRDLLEEELANRAGAGVRTVSE